jgi:hypothetical protein
VLEFYGVGLLSGEAIEDLVGAGGYSGYSSSGAGGGPPPVLAMVTEFCGGGSMRELLHTIGACCVVLPTHI